jgi:catechol 2,3-dioxygenase-like lactoylglutathione lyase family enzyme
MPQPLGTDVVTQVALVVKDIEAVKTRYAALLGCPVPPTVTGGAYEVSRTVYHGAPAPRAGCQMAFFDVSPTTQLEIIQPNGEPSAWQDYLDEHGEGVHHLAFGVTNTSARLEAATAEFGWTVIQRGQYGDASGEYAYLDSYADLKVYLETLESY